MITGDLSQLCAPLIANIAAGNKVLGLRHRSRPPRLRGRVGGAARSRIHLCGVSLEPTLEVDGHERVIDGAFVTPFEDAVRRTTTNSTTA